MFYKKYKDMCIIFSDVNYPVETNFLNSVTKDDLKNREFDMPYPLYDIANFVDIKIDRVKVYEKYCHEKLRKHHPIDDAKASIYCYFRYMRNLKLA